MNHRESDIDIGFYTKNKK
ncbi:hypothetical protein OD999_25955 [Priestia megaterium]|nr:hypothetical protein [Priestia megaterium]MCU7712602.1 hypothetical protein [Priestia megaterium]